MRALAQAFTEQILILDLFITEQRHILPRRDATRPHASAQPTRSGAHVLAVSFFMRLIIVLPMVRLHLRAGWDVRVNLGSCPAALCGCSQDSLTCCIMLLSLRQRATQTRKFRRSCTALPLFALPAAHVSVPGCCSCLS